MHLEIPFTMTIIRDDIEQCRFTSARVSKKNVTSIQKGHRLSLTSTILSKLYRASFVCTLFTFITPHQFKHLPSRECNPLLTRKEC